MDATIPVPPASAFTRGPAGDPLLRSFRRATHQVRADYLRGEDMPTGAEARTMPSITTWDRDSDPGDITRGRNPETLDMVSVDRPVFLSMIRLLQLMSPQLYMELNPLLRIGTPRPEIPTVSKDALATVNDMIKTLWGGDKLIVIPMVLQIDSNSSTRRETDQPVQGLNVRTKVIVAAESGIIEKEISVVKSRYRFQDADDCIRSGLDLIKMLLLGRLVTKPSKSALKSRDMTADDRSRASTRVTGLSDSYSLHSQRSGSPKSSYSRSRNDKSIGGRLRRVLQLY